MVEQGEGCSERTSIQVNEFSTKDPSAVKSKTEEGGIEISRQEVVPLV